MGVVVGGARPGGGSAGIAEGQGGGTSDGPRKVMGELDAIRGELAAEHTLAALAVVIR